MANEQPNLDRFENSILQLKEQDKEFISQNTSAEETDAVQPTEDDEKAWRLYVDLYGFLPITTETETELNGNKLRDTLSLGDVLESATGVFTGRAAVEYERVGFQTAVNYGSSYLSEKVGEWDFDNPLRFQINPDFPSLPDRRIKAKGSIKTDTNFKQALVDLALRYRVGDIQRPKMEKGSFSFIGFAGARIIDASLDIDAKFSNDVTFEGRFLPRKISKSIEKKASQSWSNTWVQPLIGMNASYAFNPDWQAFVYLDAGGFGLNGQRDLSGTAQAGIAYALGNSAQLSLSYKYFKLDFAKAGSNNGYLTQQNGFNIGLRWFFDKKP